MSLPRGVSADFVIALAARRADQPDHLTAQNRVLVAQLVQRGLVERCNRTGRRDPRIARPRFFRLSGKGRIAAYELQRARGESPSICPPEPGPVKCRVFEPFGG